MQRTGFRRLRPLPRAAEGWRWVLCLVSVALIGAGGEGPPWLVHLRGLSFGERLAEIRAVSTLPRAAQMERVPALVRLLRDNDQSVRITAAAELAELHEISASALPALIEKFDEPHGEEGMEYVSAASKFGERALPLLQEALKSDSWLIRARACDAIRLVNPSLYRDGECKVRAR